jgi:SAM-dependent methyltransferase
MTCRLCGNDKLIFFYNLGNKNQFKYYRCENCGLVSLDLDGLEIISHQFQYTERFILPDQPKYESGAMNAYQFIKKYVPVKGTYLDIGCGNGGVLYFAQKDGWIIKGLELSPKWADFVSKRLNIKVIIADFLKYDNPTGEKFDLISLRHVLEHLPDSILAMNKISGLLNEGGYVHLEFPNILGVTHRLKRFLKNKGIHETKYNPGWKPGHCNEFSKKSFSFLLKTTGFKLIKWETYSFKSFENFIYNHIPIGAKARAIIQKQ